MKQRTVPIDELKRELRPEKGNKYRARKVTIDGIRFDSRAEGARYIQLREMEAQGQIVWLTRQPHFDIVVEGVKIGRGYTADFEYFTRPDRVRIIEDVKGVKTRDLGWRLQLVKLIYKVEVKLVKMDYRLVNDLLNQAAIEGRIEREET